MLGSYCEKLTGGASVASMLNNEKLIVGNLKISVELVYWAGCRELFLIQSHKFNLMREAGCNGGRD